MATKNKNGPIVSADTIRVIEKLRGIGVGYWEFFDISDSVLVANIIHRIHNKLNKYGCDLWDRKYQIRTVEYIGSIIVARGR